MDDQQFDALTRTISRFFSRRHIGQILGGAVAIGVVGAHSQDAGAICVPCKVMCKGKKGKKKKRCLKKCVASRPAAVVCPTESAVCRYYRSVCGINGYLEDGNMVACSTEGGLCKCSEPGCNCTPVSGGFLSQTSCSCTPPGCATLNPEGKCGRFDTVCGPVVCNGTCDTGTCGPYGICA